MVKASPGAAALHLELEPVKTPLAFKLGQFGFISLKEEGLREPHPFTIVSRSEDGHVHFVIRDLGDYTHRLTREATVGMHADIYAPFGRFSRPADGKREVWIAGGVGISPFIAWLTDEQQVALSRATLFYFFTPGREFPSAARIEELTRRAAMEFVAIPTGPTAPEFLERFEAIVREAVGENVVIAFCGPRGLLEHVRAQMRRLGVPDANLHYEYFEFR